MYKLSNALKDRIRSLIPSGIKHHIAKILTSDKIGRSIKDRGCISRGGVVIWVDDPRVSNREAAAIFFGIRERAELDVVQRMLDINPLVDVIELGSSIGYIASHIVKRNPRKLIVVEADSELLGLCKKNIMSNCSSNADIRYLNKAISYSDNGMVFFRRGATTTSGQLVDYHDERGNYIVQSIKLSDVIRENNIDRYILVSDIEGAEAEIFFEDKDALDRCVAIVVELEDTKHYTQENQVAQILRLGFFMVYSYGRVFLFKRL